MSGIWKRKKRSDIQTPTIRKGRKQLRLNLTPPRQISTLPAVHDDRPKRRLFELLKSQGMQENQQVVFLSDGGEDVRNLQFYLNPQAEHLLDWST